MRYEIGRWLANRLQTLLEGAMPRVIMDGLGKSPYLSRYYVVGAPKMPDGSSPFDKFGNPKREAVWKDGWGLYIHRFHRSDVDREAHNHPWAWALSFIIAGGYREERRYGNEMRTREVKPLSFNFIRSTDFHRVDLIEHDAWTLFLVGPKTKTWGFWDRNTGRYTPWREFLAAKQRESPCTCFHAPEQHCTREQGPYEDGSMCHVNGCDCKASREDKKRDYDAQKAMS
jgi:hypothetical protein